MGKKFFLKCKFDKKDIIIMIILTAFLIGTYLVYILQEAKEIPFIYNQF